MKLSTRVEIKDDITNSRCHYHCRLQGPRKSGNKIDPNLHINKLTVSISRPILATIIKIHCRRRELLY